MVIHFGQHMSDHFTPVLLCRRFIILMMQMYYIIKLKYTDISKLYI